jgi:hypothetical protein
MTGSFRYEEKSSEKSRLSPDRRGLATVRINGSSTYLWMIAAFAIALVLAAIAFASLGAGERGISIALRLTARWSFLLFWFAYAGGAITKLSGLRLGGLERRGREFGLAFASAQLVHVGLVLWLFYILTGPVDAMVFFWIGVLCTYLLSLFSLPRLRDALGLRISWVIRLLALEYIALVFADDFILLPLQASGFRSYPLSYLPFAFMLVGAMGVRLATICQTRPLASQARG